MTEFEWELVNDAVLYGLLIGSTITAVCILLLVAGAVRLKLSDLAHQRQRKIVGRARIQSWMDLRAQVNLLLLSLLFILINGLLLGEAPQIVRMWVNRGGWQLLLLIVLMNCILDAFAERKQVKLLIDEEDKHQIPEQRP